MAGPPVAESGVARPLSAVLIERLCSKTLRVNEEDRLLGEIGLSVRSTIKYQRGVFSPDLIDDAVQEATGAIIQACPQLSATDDAHRLGAMIQIAQAITLRLLADPTRKYSPQQTERASAADLSQELTTQEIDAWLEGLPPRQRAVALFLYASDVTPQDVAAAVGRPAQAITTAFGDTKTNLLRFYRADDSIDTQPAMSLRIAGERARPVLSLLQPDPTVFRPAETAAAAASEAARPVQIRISGISSDLYSGWSLLATVSGLPPDERLVIGEPFLLEPDKPGLRRMLVAEAAEISEPNDVPRRFLLKAYAIDGQREGSGLRDTFHLAAPTVDNVEARHTVSRRNLSSIEITRCLWHDYGGDDPGLCR